jgi:diaminohydroxyphosphoribosylaminopyrimidine deaminase/5-amino-6-(5-phosphoribosylamino)uracil reductase
MRRALELARQAWGRTHPNPMVGAVITEGGRIVAEGFHAKAGEPHAEVMALRALGRRPAPDAVLHVTLEPCCTHGRTPPCVDAILAAGIRTVVVGARDPNPAHAGHGLDLLRTRGVAVVEGVLGEECAALNLIFNHWIVRGSPLLALKVAATLDGKLTLPAGQGTAITGPESAAYVHRLRRLYPAIAVSADTALADNPRLTARGDEGESCPVRFVLDRHFKTAGRTGLHLFQDAHRSRTIVVGLGSSARKADLAWYEAEGIKVWSLVGEEASFLKVWAERCAQERITGVLIEGGPRLASALLAAGAVDYLYAFVAPRTGDPAAPSWHEGASLPAGRLRASLAGSDVLWQGFLG